MQLRHVALTIALAGLATACQDNSPTATLSVFESDAAFAMASNGKNAAVPLAGDNEIPARDTRARGTATFHLSKDGTELSYKLIVANIENVTQSHIHMAPAGTNGGIVVWLYPSAPPLQLIPGRTQGVLAEGEITSANVIGGLAGQGLDGLLAAIRAGNTYVNAHTSQFPPGEIRGQIN
jgi:hypothetical protein